MQCADGAIPVLGKESRAAATVAVIIMNDDDDDDDDDDNQSTIYRHPTHMLHLNYITH